MYMYLHSRYFYSRHTCIVQFSMSSGEAEKELLFPCMSEVKSKLQSGQDREEVELVENLFEQKNFQDATKVSLKTYTLNSTYFETIYS